ncbi:MAG: Uma2 family endonuclease [Myxococcales bacterium]|nr:Uma2 family endonuclease [Myxococcales bacterium]
MVSPVVAIDPAWQRPLTVEEYHRMIDVGILGEDERVELLEGVMVAMSPQGIPHVKAITTLTRLMCRVTEGSSLEVRPQVPLTLARSEPEPALAITEGRARWPRGRHPETALLVVEVASDSLGKDLGPKAAIYAEAGVTEYWVIDVERQVIHVHAGPDPVGRRYADLRVVAPGATLICGALPALVVTVADLF